jgi:NAD/NADP transhydrogenase beta subunit
MLDGDWSSDVCSSDLLKITAVITTLLLVVGLIVGIYARQVMIGNIMLWGSAIAFLFYLGALQDLARNLGRKHVLWLLLTLVFLPLSFPISFMLISRAAQAFLRLRTAIPA